METVRFWKLIIMIAILFPIDIVWVPFIALLFAIAGFSFRSKQLRSLKKQVSTLEKEMLNSHAEILNMQQEMVRLQGKNAASKSLVVAMKDLPADDAKETDNSNRKMVK